MKYGLIGEHLAHSYSQQLFDKFCFDASYELIPIPQLKFEETIPHVLNQYHGLNVTIPYKERIIPHLHQLSSEASEIRAVNCISNQNGRLIGHNTDAYGFWQSVLSVIPNRKIEHALILGTGGSSRAVQYALNTWGRVQSIDIASRDANKGIAYHAISSQYLSKIDLIVNCTPVGMYPDIEQALTIDFSAMHADALVVDLIYNPQQTLWLQQAQQYNLKTLNGLKMLELQALKSYEIWGLIDLDLN